MKMLLILLAMFSLIGCGLLKPLKNEPSEVVSLMSAKYCQAPETVLALAITVSHTLGRIN